MWEGGERAVECVGALCEGSNQSMQGVSPRSQHAGRSALLPSSHGAAATQHLDMRRHPGPTAATPWAAGPGVHGQQGSQGEAGRAMRPQAQPDAHIMGAAMMWRQAVHPVLLALFPSIASIFAHLPH